VIVDKDTVERSQAPKLVHCEGDELSA
jgi:ATP-dependent Clp protease ATP-binding subunit ClpX